MADILINKLRKTYDKGNIVAVDDVSLEIARGELFGLIGPDGAGKTSIFRMLTTLLLPDSGNASVLGLAIVQDYKKIRKKVGYMPGRFSLYQDLSVEENLNFFATVFETTVQENYSLIKEIYEQIEPFKKRPAGKLSGGMKQKLALCCALVHRPEVLFLDEPTTGVDAVSRREFWDMLGRLKLQGITIMVSTPYMDEAALCERVALMQSGKIMSIDTPERIRGKYPNKLFAIRANRMSELLKELRNSSVIKSCFAFGEYHHISFTNNSGKQEETLLAGLSDIGYTGVELKEIKPSIEDCFIELMSNSEVKSTNASIEKT
ncbi:MAG: ABC transporter ATP-binding protein [Chitinophagaceae bacterium]